MQLTTGLGVRFHNFSDSPSRVSSLDSGLLVFLSSSHRAGKTAYLFCMRVLARLLPF